SGSDCARLPLICTMRAKLAMLTTGRLFFALWPHEDAVRSIAGNQAALDGRLTHPNDFHLTLAFLGRQPRHRLPGLVELVHALDAHAIPLDIDRYGCFERLRLVWAGPSQTPDRLTSLRQDLLDAPALEGLDVRREARFVPHVTLARKSRMPSV